MLIFAEFSIERKNIFFYFVLKICIKLHNFHQNTNNRQKRGRKLFEIVLWSQYLLLIAADLKIKTNDSPGKKYNFFIKTTQHHSKLSDVSQSLETWTLTLKAGKKI
ncbi:hypothetical protein BpHYR1_000701 [Brachionus plicatilis]|uniref:Uncharacterized protein n=1 Tax=Brachionus plicatilis TaxID=10195 RepID=A0A3M7T6D9_BRAPC|nr:hypothetical protein BpHYR1_000701 [Brachionus plicatilis]